MCTDAKNISYSASLIEKSDATWQEISNYTELKQMFKDIILNKYTSPWRFGLFDDPDKKSYSTPELNEKIVTAIDLDFLIDDYNIEVHEIKGNKEYCQKAFLSGWIHRDCCYKFVNYMNTQLNLIAYFTDLPDSKDLESFNTGITTYCTKKLDAIVDISPTDYLYRKKNSAVFTGKNINILKNLFNDMLHIKVINTNFLDKRGSLLDKTIEFLKSI
jgi:hypothetical protein